MQKFRQYIQNIKKQFAMMNLKNEIGFRRGSFLSMKRFIQRIFFHLKISASNDMASVIGKCFRNEIYELSQPIPIRNIFARKARQTNAFFVKHPGIRNILESRKPN